jgi:transposase InsO family protein
MSPGARPEMISNTHNSISLPKLSDNGSNWIVYKSRILATIKARGLGRYIRGAALIPDPPPTFPSGHVHTADEKAKIEAALVKIDEYEAKEEEARAIILSTISEDLHVKVISALTTKEMWDAVCEEHEGKTEIFQMDMRRRLQNSRCDEHEDVSSHLSKLGKMRQDLASTGAPLTDADYCSIIVNSLPSSYRQLISNSYAASKIMKKTITAAEILRAVEEEYTHRNLYNGPAVMQANALTSRTTVAAIAAAPRSNPTTHDGTREKKKRERPKCSNPKCNRRLGHTFENCWAEGGGKEGQRPKNRKPTTAALANVEDYAFSILSEKTIIAMTSSMDQEPVIFDSGASQHICPSREQFTKFSTNLPRKIVTADGRTVESEGGGEVLVKIATEKGHSDLKLRNVLYAPSISYTLISLSSLDSSGISTIIEKGNLRLIDRNSEGSVLGEIKARNGIWQLNVNEKPVIAAVARTTDDLHRILGHISPTAATNLVKRGKVEGIELTEAQNHEFCEVCVRAKIKRLPFPKERSNPATRMGEVIHSDVWGPSQTSSIGGRRYWCTFIDEYTRWGEIFFLRTKDEVLAKYITFEARMETQHGFRIKRLMSDRGGEYLGSEFSKHLESRGTVRLLTTHDSPSSNGIAERCNGVIAQHVRAMLIETDLPKHLWAEAAHHAMWLRNRTTSNSTTSKTPYQMIYGQPPNLAKLRGWGAKVWVRSLTAGKLDVRGRLSRFVGYDNESKGVRVYWPESRSIGVERDIIFDDSPTEVVIPMERPEVKLTNDEPATQGDESAEDVSESHTGEISKMKDSPDEPAEVRKSTRERKPSSYMRRLLAGEGTVDGRERAEPIREIEMAMSAMVPFGEPNTVKEAERRDDWEEWRKAMDEEITSLESFQTWKVVDYQKGTHVIGSRWVFRLKHDAGGHISSYKARVVAKGYSQHFGIDYTDTFAPVAKLASIRSTIAISIAYNWELHQMDVKSAYLNGELDEVIYMEPPPGYLPESSSRKVCLLQKSLYGLKQAGRQWYKKLSMSFADMGFSKCTVDHAVFFIQNDDGKSIICCATDDLTIAASSPTFMSKVKSLLNERWEMKDLGELHWMLGMEVKRDRERRTGSIGQSAYINHICERFNLQDAKPLSTPMDPGEHLTKSQSPSTPKQIDDMRDVPYREAVGSLMYAALGTRPDITYAVTALSQFLQNPGKSHWEAVKRVFRYLKGTQSIGLSFGGETEPSVQGFCDSDWGTDPDSRHSISGYVFLINGGPVSWSSKKQNIVALSSTEAEYISLTHASKEAVWLRSLLGDILNKSYAIKPLDLHCDNQSAISLVRNSMFHSRTKHIAIRYHYIRELYEEGAIDVIYRATDDMPADLLTKPLAKAKVIYLRKLMGIVVA